MRGDGMIDIIGNLEARGFFEQISEEAVRDSFKDDKQIIYAGFDPTSDSLHLGHLVPIMALAHFQRAGNKVLAVVGGATAMIGDPSGKSKERNLLTREQVRLNSESIKKQLSIFLDFDGENAALMLDNYDWIGSLSLIEWLRVIGKFFTVNYMISKDSVRTRMASQNGISFTEFSYMTMQAYDFMYLYDKYNCNIQLGGNDQWGNITAGIDLIHKVYGAKGYGVTVPLLATSTGEKFGKTAGNAVWLDGTRTSPYSFYQYFIGTTDDDVERFLKLFTFLDMKEIADICVIHKMVPEKRKAQKRLAEEVTRMVHGKDGLERAKRASEALFGGSLDDLSRKEIEEVFVDVPSGDIERLRLVGILPIVDFLVDTKVLSSKGEVRRTIGQGGVYINNKRVAGVDVSVSCDDVLQSDVVVVRIGKKQYRLIYVI